MSEKKPWRIRFHGPVGQALERFCFSQLSEMDFDRLLEPYRCRTGPSCGKDVLLWGQCVSSALLCLPFLDGAELLEEKVRKTIDDMISLQDSSGALTAFPEHLQLQGLDIPGRRYVLKALLLAAAMPRADEKIKACCIAMTDQLMGLIGPGKRSIIHCGTLGGLDSSALLDVVSQLYALTEEPRFLGFARYIAGCGGSQQHDIFKALGSGMAPALLAGGHAPGITGCFKGLAELGQRDIEYAAKYRELCELYMERIAAEELFITGTGGGGEAGDLWCRGAFRQTAADPLKSCCGSVDVTVSCLEFFDALSALSDACTPFALSERSFYNALLRAWNKNTDTFDLLGPAPLTDVREKRSPEHSTLYDAFRGGEAFALFPHMAIKTTEKSAVLNFYEDMEAHLSRKTLIRVTGGYPGSGKVHISIRSRKPFSISLRIPEGCTGVYYCDCLLAWKPDSYLTINRSWEPDEVLTIELEPHARKVSPPDGSPFQAFMRGPLVMAAEDPGAAAAEFQARLQRYRLELTDFASAGKAGEVQKHFAVWLRKFIPDYLTCELDYFRHS